MKNKKEFLYLMATLQIQEIPDSLYQQINEIALAQGYSLNTFVLRTLQRVIDEEKRRQARSKALSNIRRRRRVLPANMPDSVTMIRQIRSAHE
jgi:hypothetical protein